MSGHKPSVCNEKWPSYREELTVESEIQLVVQVNGKVRAKIDTVKGLNESEAFNLAEQNENVKRYLDGNTIVKKFYIQDKIVNYVIR